MRKRVQQKKKLKALINNREHKEVRRGNFRAEKFNGQKKSKQIKQKIKSTRSEQNRKLAHIQK